MSVYIPNMEMPKGCATCPYCDRAWNKPKCKAKSVQGRFMEQRLNLDRTRQKWCPLIPVPEHGDLIERDTLSKRIKEETINQAEFYADRWHPVVLAYGDCYGKVQNAPTIIPADKEGEG